MNSKLFMVVAGITFLTACSVPGENEMKWFDRAVNTSEHQLLYMAEKIETRTGYPLFSTFFKRWRIPVGKTFRLDFRFFFPGSMWLAYELTANEKLAKQARLYTDRLEAMQYYTKKP